jgi:hypothetical protein
LFAVAGLCAGSTVVPIPPALVRVLPYAGYQDTQLFTGHERAAVIAIGNDASRLGLYVFDANGNCIALDDQGGAAKDDLAVGWFPPRTGPYSFEIRNLGRNLNIFKLAVR